METRSRRERAVRWHWDSQGERRGSEGTCDAIGEFNSGGDERRGVGLRTIASYVFLGGRVNVRKICGQV